MVMLPGEAPMVAVQPSLHAVPTASCVNLADHCGRTPLYVAATAGQRSAAICLLNHGADITSTVASGEEAGRGVLHAAAHAGHMDVLHLLLTYEAVLDARDVHGRSALHLAAEEGHLEVVRLLLWSGCDANAQDELGQTALMAVFSTSDYPNEARSRVVSLLLQHTDPDLIDNRKRSALHRLVYHQQEALVTTALTWGWKVNQQDACLRTPLHEALVEPDRLHVGCICRLLAAGANPQLADAQGVTALQLLSRPPAAGLAPLRAALRDWTYGHLPEFGQSLLHGAVAAQDRELAAFLLRCGVAANLQDNSGLAPLHLAASLGQPGMLQMLLRHGASINQSDATHMTALHHAAMLPDPVCTNVLLEATATLEARDRGGLTPLHRAVGWGSKATTRALIRAGANVNVEEDAGRRPLHLAADTGSVPFTALLLAEGAQVDAQDVKGESALHIAASRGRSALLRILLQGGATLDQRDAYMRTALHHACIAGQMAAVELLVAEGADITARDKGGRRPDQAAQQAGCHAVLEYMRRQHRRSMLMSQEMSELDDLINRLTNTTASSSPHVIKSTVTKAASCDVLCTTDKAASLDRRSLGNSRMTSASARELWKPRKLHLPGKGACCAIS